MASSHGVARTTRIRTPAQREADKQKIAVYRDLDARLLALNASPYPSPAFADPSVLSLTAQVLSRNPEHYTAWNVRRRCLTCGSFSRPPPSAPPATSAPTTPSPSSAASSSSPSATTRPEPPSQPPPPSGPSDTRVEDGQKEEEQQPVADHNEVLRSELEFTFPLIRANPKCYWIWNYRLWLLQQAINLLPVPVARRIWEEELGLVGLMLNKDPRNFHAWGYRRHLVSNLESRALAGATMAEAEFAYTQKKITSGLSNFSAWHYRGRLIPELLAERRAGDADRRSFLDDEFSLIRRALDVGPEDQSCWYYHQFLVSNITSPPTRLTIAPNLSSAEKVSILRREMEYIRDLLEDYDEDIKLAYEALLDHILAVARLENRDTTAEEKGELASLLAKLRASDPMRKGRWDDFEKNMGASPP
ncbi:hypothetical protein ACRALDRAFT_1082841 [Sodiomyces alcalophilus JCM 7366]|uniref:uncharacterized protein n=1 Tax=Sodiomyces alcalophilus JCM 7366 TaxID=591952 RepID=UPI0039B4EB87